MVVNVIVSVGHIDILPAGHTKMSWDDVTVPWLAVIIVA